MLDSYDEAVLEDINIHVKPGQVIALWAQRFWKDLLVNLLPASMNTLLAVLLDGVELSEYPRRYLRSQISIVSRNPFSFPRHS